jgi:hypothetical protein
MNERKVEDGGRSLTFGPHFMEGRRFQDLGKSSDGRRVEHASGSMASYSFYMGGFFHDLIWRKNPFAHFLNNLRKTFLLVFLTIWKKVLSQFWKACNCNILYFGQFLLWVGEFSSLCKHVFSMPKIALSLHINCGSSFWLSCLPNHLSNCPSFPIKTQRMRFS